MSLLTDNTFALAMNAVAAVGAVSAIGVFRSKLNMLKRESEAIKADSSEQSRLLNQEISFYEERKFTLAKHAGQRRLLSEAARGLGALLDPMQIQQKLIQISQLLFPSRAVTISYGQRPDAVDTFVGQRRQPLLVPSDLMKGPPMLAVPISAQQSVVGVLRVGADGNAAAFTRDDLRLLEILASLASLAMDNCMLFHQVQQTALRDNLTGLLTHRAFQDQLEEAVLEASRFNQPLSIILVDVDHFKSINDTYGHQAGDVALQGVSHVMDRNARSIDILARYGGEEFAILLRQTTNVEAAALAEQIRRDLSEQTFDVGRRTIAITASFGVATFPEDATSGQQLFRQADQRLYKAKASGRNRVQARAA